MRRRRSYSLDLGEHGLWGLVAALVMYGVASFVFGYVAGAIGHGAKRKEFAAAPTQSKMQAEAIEAPRTTQKSTTLTPAPKPTIPASRSRSAAKEAPRKASKEKTASNNASSVSPTTSKWWVQLGSFSTRRAADAVRSRAESLGFPGMVTVLAMGGAYKVRVGPLPSKESAQRVAKRLSRSGFKGAWVVASR